MSLLAACTRVYMLRAKTAHLVFADTTLSGVPRALCRIRPYLDRPWFGTGDQAEYERAAALPLCARCAAVAESPELPAVASTLAAAGTSSVAPSPARDGATDHDARETVPPSVLAPALESVSPALPGPSGLPSPPMHPPHEEGSPDSSPPGTESGAAAAVPGGSTPLAGKDARTAWKAAESANAVARRNGRGRYPVKRRGDGYAPGGNRRMPPGGGAA